MSDQKGDYIAGLFGVEAELLASLREEAAREGLPAIAISADEGRLLQVLLTSIGARRVLEVGTLGGYSAICMARALPNNGRVLSLEIEETHARFARRYIERADLADRIEVRVGRALVLCVVRIGSGRGRPKADVAVLRVGDDEIVRLVLA